MFFRAAVLIFSLLVGACGALEQRLNTTNDQTYAESLRRMQEHMTDEQKADFHAALIGLAMSDVPIDSDHPLASLEALASVTPEQLRSNLAAHANGRTAREIVQLHFTRQLNRTDEQIASLQRDLAASEAVYQGARAQLDAIKVAGARFYWAGEYILEPVIVLSITNNGQTPLSRIFFHGKVETPGRSIPWIDADFNYLVVGGLEPGETRRLSLSPNRFGEWGVEETQGRHDLVLTVTVVDFEGPTHQRLLNLTPEEMQASRDQITSLQRARADLFAKIHRE